MQFKRRHKGKTNYHKRLELLKSGSSRLVVRKTLKYINAQIADFDKKGDKILVAANSRELKKIGWNFACDNIPAAYLTGLLVGKRSVEKKINEAVLDTGLYQSVKGARIYATVKGAKDAGLSVPIDEDVMPTDERLKGEHISANEKFKNLASEFEKVKQKIIGG